MSGWVRKMRRENGLHIEIGKRVAVGLAAAGFLLSPVHVRASEITKADSANAGTITQNGGVFDILADGVAGSNAYNVFSKFSLDGGNIANMYFGSSKDGASALNLLNVVKDSNGVVINGVVNAMREHRIGGNIYFINEKGVTVGATGVINAGSISLVTPAHLNDVKYSDAGFNPADLTNGKITVNPSGTISIAGQLNAVDGINISAGTIKVVKADGAAQGAVLRTEDSIDFSALVNTGAVNADVTGGTLTASEDASGDIVLSAVVHSTAPSAADEALSQLGYMTREATVTTDAGTSIISRGAAKLSSSARNEDISVKSEASQGLDFLLDEGANPLGQIVFVTADTTVNGNVTGKTVDISATAYNQYNSTNDANKWENIHKDVQGALGFDESWYKIDKLASTLQVTPIYSYMETKADVNIGADAVIRATREAAWKTDEAGAFVTDANGLRTAIPALSVNASATTNNITSATTKIDDSYARRERKEGASPYKNTSRLAGASVTYLGGYNRANVTIEGDLSAKGAVETKATATDVLRATSTVASVAPTKTGSAALTDAAVAVATGNNYANVDIRENASVKSENHIVNVAATATNSIDVTATVQASAGAAAATGVSVLDYKSGATVSIDGAVSGKAKTDGGAAVDASTVSVKALNTISRNNVSANNALVGKNPPAKREENDAANANSNIRQAAVGGTDNDDSGTLMDMVADSIGVDSSGTSLQSGAGAVVGSSAGEALKSLSKYLTAGASVAVANETNDAKVRIGKTGSIEGEDGAVNIGAATQMDEVFMTSMGTLTNVNKNLSSTVELDAAVLVANIQNNAEVTVDSGTAEQHAKISGGSVDVRALSHQDWGRVDAMIADYVLVYNNLVKIYNDFADMGDAEDFTDVMADIEAAMRDIRTEVTVTTGLDINDYIGDEVTNMPHSIGGLAENIASFFAGLNKISNAKDNNFSSELTSIYNSLNRYMTMFAKPENYGNFVAAASVNAVGSSNENAAQFNQGRHSGTELSVAGAVNVNRLDNKANVNLGDYAVIEAAKGAAAVGADTKQNTVAMNGRVNIDVNFMPVFTWLEQKRLHGKDYTEKLPWNQVLAFSDNASGPNAVGGTVGVATRNTDGSVAVGKHAEITGYAKIIDNEGNAAIGNGVTMQGNNETVTTDITFGAGEASTVGVQGMVGIVDGDAKSGVTVGSGTKINAKSLDDAARHSGVNISGGSDTVLTNVVGAISRANGAAMGASVAVTEYDIANIVNVSGTLDAASVNLDALTDGVINTIAVAGTASTTGKDKSGAAEPGNVLAGNENLVKAEKHADELVDDSSDDLYDNTKEALSHTANSDQGSNDLEKFPGREKETKIPKPDIALAGSVSVNDVTSETTAKLDGAIVRLHQADDGDAAKLKAKAEDASFIGSWSGGTAITWQQSKKTKSRGHQPRLGAPLGYDDSSYDDDYSWDYGDSLDNHETSGGWDVGASDDGPPRAVETEEQINARRNANQAATENALNGVEGSPTKNGAPSVALAGAAAVNLTDQKVYSGIDATTIEHAALVQNFAEKDGATVAAALALDVTREQGEGFALDGTASVSYTQAQSDVRAHIGNSYLQDGEDTKLSNVAYDSDTQVTGGVNLDVMRGGGTTVGLGGTVTLADIKNTLAAEIEGGSYTGVGTLTNHAALDLTQVGTAVGTTITTGAKSNYGFEGAAAVNLLKNDVSATIGDKERVNNQTVIDAKSADVAAYDSDNQNLNKYFDDYLGTVGIDSRGETYLDIAKDNAATDDGGNGADTYADKIDTTSGGTTIVTVGVALSDSTSSRGVGLAGAASAATMDNDFTAKVENATITASGDDDGHGLDVRANADGLLVNAAAGETASGGSFNGAGSVSVQLTNNDVLAEVNNSTVEADDVNVKASTETSEVNVAGQIAGAKNGGGLALALNTLDNSTKALVTETTIKAVETKIAETYDHKDLKEALTGNAVSVAAENTGSVIAVGAGVGIGKTAGLTGSLALNFGQDQLAAVIEGREKNAYSTANELKNIRTLNVSSTNDAYKLAVAGGVAGAGKAAVGGAVAYNEMGTWNGNTADPNGKQQNTAAVKNVDVTTMDWAWLEKLGYMENATDDDKKITKTDATIAINASDSSDLVTVAAGVGGAGTAAVEGAAAVSRLGRVTGVEMSQMSVDEEISNEELANREKLNTALHLNLSRSDMEYARNTYGALTASASSDGSTVNTADVVAVSGDASVGAGVAVTQDSADVTAKMTGGIQTVDDFALKAASNDAITDVAAGIGASGHAGITGSVTVNLLDGETVAEISGASSVNSRNNAVIAAQSDATITNVAGGLSFAAEGAAVGLSVGVNEINTKTRAAVSGGVADVMAGANPDRAALISDTVADGEILDDFPGVAAVGRMNRQATEYEGTVISASGTAALSSSIVNVGAAAIGAAVNGGVNVNTLGGKTEAFADAAALGGKNVSVVAHDYANNAALIGQGGLTVEGASVGVGVNVMEISRDTAATVSHDRQNNRENISFGNVDGIKVEAASKHGLASQNVGVSVGGIGASVGNVDDVLTFTGKTEATLSNIEAIFGQSDSNETAGNLDVTANRMARLHTREITTGLEVAGGAVGAAVNVVEDKGGAKASFENSRIDFEEGYEDGVGGINHSGETAVNVKAKSDVADTYEQYSADAAGGGGVGVTVSVANTASDVKATMKNVALGEKDQYAPENVYANRSAKSVAIEAENNIAVRQSDWAAGGGVGGVGVGVNVANVDGTAEASVADSKIYSVSDVKVDAKENRAVTSFNGNTAAGFGAVGANVSVVTVGQEIDEASYQSAYDWTNANGTTETRTVKAKDDAGAEISAAYDKAQTVIEDGELLSSQAFGYAGIPAKQDVTLSRGGQASAVTAAMENSSVLSGGNIKVASAEHTDVKIEQYGFGAGVASVNGTVAVLDTNRNAATKVDGSSLTAYGNIDVTSDVSGTAGASAIQGTAGAAAALNGAFAFSDAANSSHLEIVGSNLGAYHMAHLAAKDSSQTELDAISVAGAGAGAIGVQVAEATTKSAAEGVDILINNSTIAALGTDAKYRPLDENGNIGDKDAIPITSWDHAVTIEAENTQTMKTNLTTVDAALAGAASVAVSEVKAGWVEKDDDTNKLKTSVTVKGNSTLKSEADEKNAIYVGAKADIAQEASMTAVDVALVGAVSVNYDGADTNSDVSVSLGENTRYDAGNGALIAKGETNLSQKLDAEGVDVSVSTISVGVGNNAVNANNTLQTTVDAGAPSVSSRLGAADLSAVSEADTSVRAQSYGGSILNVAAAEADNTLTNTTAVNIGGTWDMKSGDFIATAQNKEKLDVEADTLAAAIVDGSGASIHSKAEETATVNLKNATVTTAQGAQIYTAENVVDDSLDIDASGYGGVSVGASDHAQKHTYNAAVNMENSALTAGGSIYGAAATTGSIAAENDVKAAGVVQVTAANSAFDTAYNNTVKATNTTLTTTGADLSGRAESLVTEAVRHGSLESDTWLLKAIKAIENDESNITLAAYDKTHLSYETYGDSQGGVTGVANAFAANKLTRANTVTIGGSSRLDSANDLNLYASRNLMGNTSSLDFTLLTEAINHSFLPLELVASLKNDMKQTNTVFIGSGVSARSIADIRIAADTGHSSLMQYTDAYNLWKDVDTSSDPGFVTTENGQLSQTETETNSAKIDGTVTAGVHSVAEVEITGQMTYTTNENGGEAKADYSGIAVNVKQGGDGLSPSSFVKNTVTRENGYWDRYEALKKLMGEYTGTAQYDDYKAEMDSLLLDMEKAGFAEKNPNKPNQGYIVYKTVEVPGIVAPDMTVSGGNIYVDAGTLAVGGAINAKGNPSISLTNKSAVNLDVNDAIIKKNGGEVYFNGGSVSSASNPEDFPKISGIGNIAAEGFDAGKKPTITIKSTAGSGDPNLRADIRVKGDVVNQTGDIEIANHHYSIVVEPEANLVAQNIKLSAAEGSVVQVNPTGTILIGSNPIQQWMNNDEAASIIQQKLHEYIESDQNLLDENKKFTKEFSGYDDYRTWLIETVGVPESYLPAAQPGTDGSGISAGKSVYVKANDVNIGGLVQSGYGDYTVTLGEDARAAVDALDAVWAEKGSKVLTDSDVLGESDYLVNASSAGSRYDNGKEQWVYAPNVYYNPYTKKLIVDSVSATPGQIYIEGKISSTGGGRLLAADGAADIKVDTSAVDRDVVVYGLQNESGDGFIRITDNLQGKVYEYKNGKSRDYVVGDVEAAANTAWANDANQTFTPKLGLTYTWTGGYGHTEVTTKQYTDESYLWGAIDNRTDEEIITEHESQATSSPAQVYNNEALDSGDYIKHTSPAQGTPFKIMAEYHQNQTQKSEVHKHEDDSAFFYFYEKVTYTWDETTRSDSTSDYNAKGDTPVAVGFMRGEGGGAISVDTFRDGNANGNLLLAGSVSAAGDNGKVSLNAKKIEGGDGSVVANDVTIAAKNGVAVTHAAQDAADDTPGTAVIDVRTEKGAVDFVSTRGNIDVKNLSSGGDTESELSRVSLAVDGNITDAAATGAAATASRVELTSRTGGVGTESAAFDIHAGQENNDHNSVSVSARTGVYLTQDSGDMRIGHIESTAGNVVLSAAGNFIDAAPHEEAEAKSTRLDRWYAHGLLSAADNAENRAQAGDAAKKLRLDGLNIRARQLAVQSVAGQDSYSNAATEQKRAAVNDVIDSYKSAAADFALDAGMKAAQNAYINAMQGATTTEEKAQAYSDYLAAREAYFSGKGFTKDEQDLIAHYAAVDKAAENYGWSKNDALYAVQQSIMNSTPGDAALGDTANIAVHGAHNITLNAGSGIGRDGEAVTIAEADFDTTANRELLANARAGEMTVERDGKGNITSVTVTQKAPVSVSTEQGGVSAESGGHIYLASTKDKSLRILDDIDAGTSDVRLEAGDGIEMLTENATIAGNDLLIYGGKGDVGTEDAPILTNLSGVLDANSGKSIVIKQTGNQVLNVETAAAAGSITLIAEKGIEMAAGGTGYLNAGDRITLAAANGDVGATNAIRIKDDGVAVNASAKDGGTIRLEGEGAGDLVLGAIEATDGNVEVSNDGGKILLARTADAERGTSAANADIKAGDISLAAKNLDLTGGTLEASNAGGALSLSAANAIKQENTETSKLVAAGKVVLTAGTTGTTDAEKNAGGNISVLSEQNTFKEVFILAADVEKGINGTVEVVSTAADGLTANFGAGENGAESLMVSGDDSSVSVKNAADNGDLTIGGGLDGEIAFAFDSAGDLTVADSGAFIGTSITLKSDGTLTVGENASLTASAGNIELASGGHFATQGKLAASGAIGVTSRDALTVSDGSISGEEITLSSVGDLKTNGTLAATNGNVTATAGGDLTLGGTSVTATKDIIAKSTGGSVTVSGGIDATTGTLDVRAAENVAIDGAATVRNVTAVAETGTITVDDDMTVGGNIALKAKSDIAADGLSTDSGKIIAESAEGDISIADAHAGGNIEVAATKGSVTLVSADSTGDNLLLTAGTDVTISGTSSAANIKVNAGNDANLSGDAEAAQDFTVEADGSFAVASTATVTAGHDFTATAKEYGENFGSIVADNDVKLESTGESLAVRNVTATNGSITATAAKDVMVGGNGTVTAKKNVIATAKDGDVNVEANVCADNLKATATEDVSIVGDVNARNVIADAQGGSVTVSGDMETGGRISLTAKENITAENLSALSGGSIMAKAAEGNIVIADAKASGNISVVATSGNVTVADASSTAGNVALEAESNLVAARITASGDISAKTRNGDEAIVSVHANGDVNLAAGQNVGLKRDSTAGQDFRILAGGNFVVDSGTALTAGNDFNAAANDYGFNAGSITAENNVSIASTGESLILHNITAKNGDVTAIAANDVVLGGDAGTVMAGGNVVAVAKGGNVVVAEHIAAGDTIDVTAAQNVNIKSTVLESAKSIFAEAKIGDVTANGAMNAQGDISLSAGNKVIFDADAKANGNISATGGNDIIFPDKLEAGGDINLHILNGEMAATTVIAGRDANLQVGQTGGMEGLRNMGGSGSGGISSADSITAGRDVTVSATNGDVNLGDVTGANSVSIFAYAPSATVRADSVKTNDLFTVLAWHEDIGAVECARYFNILLMSGDRVRKATGWDSALDAERWLEWEDYRFHYDLLNLSHVIDIYDYWRRLPRNAEEEELSIEEM